MLKKFLKSLLGSKRRYSSSSSRRRYSKKANYYGHSHYKRSSRRYSSRSHSSWSWFIILKIKRIINGRLTISLIKHRTTS